MMRPERGGTEVRSEGVGGVGKAVGSRVGYLERRWFGRSAGRCCGRRGLVLRRWGVYVTCAGGGDEGVLVNL